jgi:hypothetical protein
MNFNFQQPSTFIVLVFCKNGLNKSCLPFKDLLAQKMLWPHVEWCKFSFHLRSLNVHNFGMVETIGLKILASMSPLMAWLLY